MTPFEPTPKSPYQLTPEVAQAKRYGQPIVALESTVITHGLPQPQNLELARSMEIIVREGGATPATIALMHGNVKVGLSETDLEHLSRAENPRKVSLRDFGVALAKKETGGTTVAATMFVAEKQNIQVFATGGIGGVHRGNLMDVSTDLMQLGRCPVMVVCAGAKAILDLPATMEYLETQGVPVIGYRTDQLPGFYSTSSGIRLKARVDSAEEAAQIAKTQWELGIKSGVLLVVPPPDEVAIEREVVENWIELALAQAEQAGIRGNAITPYLLEKVSRLSQGRSMQTNIALLQNNARVAAEVARFLAPGFPGKQFV
ncbi:MAG: pseudouridine-5'-phosphate glycosidase [Anaerolineaceae bacterium]|jgi:pseudouridine-5'-phosphate glycosidase|nr:pseudouridine-5'-phosphate glycosidase [Anaerolineaceae bacterium]MDD4042772.1 pseudouridine-5'-phosphate glycosidase [Anaerolineaceae bacterium]MDD4577369.1 pseudouridine-5'-phosphate glycosidase [Anaerolineaceae bacterium]